MGRGRAGLAGLPVLPAVVCVVFAFRKLPLREPDPDEALLEGATPEGRIDLTQGETLVAADLMPVGLEAPASAEPERSNAEPR